LYLDAKHEKVLAGELGEAKQLAMEILVKVGDAMDANSLVPISSSHVLAHYSSLHEAGIQMLEMFAKAGGKFAVRTTVDPASIDLENWRKFGIANDYARKQFRLERAYLALGGEPCWTCVQYQVCNFPKKGENVAWAESNSVVYANSIIGCRTNKITSGLDIACAVVGFTPSYGMLLEENRVAEVNFALNLDSISDLDFRSIGFYIGRHCKGKLPALSGLSRFTRLDDLKHLGAAAATGGPVTMIHYIGFTPGSSTLSKATDGEKVEIIEITRKELEEEVEKELNETDEDPDLIALGIPHLSLEELEDVANKLHQRKLKARVKMFVYTSKQVYNDATRSGIRKKIEASGAYLTHSTDGEISPLGEMGYHVVMTNSAKLAETLMSEGVIKVRYLSLNEIIEKTTKVK
jgi:predicted aconitase